jgi:hypothetical protein
MGFIPTYTISIVRTRDIILWLLLLNIPLADKAVIEDYLKSSGVPHAVLLTGWFPENLWKCVIRHFLAIST